VLLHYPKEKRAINERKVKIPKRTSMNETKGPSAAQVENAVKKKTKNYTNYISIYEYQKKNLVCAMSDGMRTSNQVHGRSTSNVFRKN